MAIKAKNCGAFPNHEKTAADAAPVVKPLNFCPADDIKKKLTSGLLLVTVILQEKKLLDLPKLLDICAIYGHENEELTRITVTNAINVQPSIHHSFSAAISHFLNIVHTMSVRCATSLEEGPSYEKTLLWAWWDVIRFVKVYYQ